MDPEIAWEIEQSWLLKENDDIIRDNRMDDLQIWGDTECAWEMRRGW